MAMHALNLKALHKLRFMGLNDPGVHTKEWALRLMANLLDKGEENEEMLSASGRLVNYVFHPEDPVSKIEVSNLIKKLLQM